MDVQVPGWEQGNGGGREQDNSLVANKQFTPEKQFKTSRKPLW